jgi:hypothetical protein
MLFSWCDQCEHPALYIEEIPGVRARDSKTVS